LPALILLILAVSIILRSAYNAGEMVYRTRIATMSETEAYQQYQTWRQSLDSDKSSGDRLDERNQYLNYLVDPLQVHVVGAGFVFALAAAALGMSLRKTALAHQAALAASAHQPVVDDGEIALAPSGRPAPPSVPIPPVALKPVPAGRFWMVTALLVLAALASGWFVIEYDHSDYNFTNFTAIYRDQILPIAKGHYRMIAHLALGGSLLLLSILLAIASQTRSRLAVWFFGLLMIAAVAAQIGVGVLMLYDGDSGPILRFNPPGGAQTAQAQ
jgi:hypothetical protein